MIPPSTSSNQQLCCICNGALSDFTRVEGDHFLHDRCHQAFLTVQQSGSLNCPHTEERDIRPLLPEDSSEVELDFKRLLGGVMAIFFFSVWAALSSLPKSEADTF